jgi:pyrroloquinoline quinone biosynthesis protein E
MPKGVEHFHRPVLVRHARYVQESVMPKGVEHFHRPVLARHARYRWDERRQQHQLVYPEGVLVLNETGAAIVRLCDGRSFAELVDALGHVFSGGAITMDLEAFLERLAKKGLIRDATSIDRGALAPPHTPPAPDPLAVVAELTYRCPLRCPYCSNPLKLRNYADELDTATWKRVLAEAAELGVVQVHFSGGEPMVRRDLPELVREARRLDLYTHLSTSAHLADRASLECLQQAGLDSVQISLQDAHPGENDWLAGTPSFARKRCAVEEAKRLRFPVTLNVVLHRHNLDHLEEIIELACQWDVDKLELAHAQYVGWAFHNRAALLPTPTQVEAAAQGVASARARLGDRLEIIHVLPDYFQPFPKACLQGWGRVFLTVAPDGAVLPCQTAREIPGLEFPNVREATLADIWFRAPVFQRFRGSDWMPEPCRSCDRREVDFGGCRCQAFLLTGDVGATDPVCHLSPSHPVVEQALREAQRTPVPLQFRVHLK